MLFTNSIVRLFLNPVNIKHQSPAFSSLLEWICQFAGSLTRTLSGSVTQWAFWRHRVQDVTKKVKVIVLMNVFSGCLLIEGFVAEQNIASNLLKKIKVQQQLIFIGSPMSWEKIPRFLCKTSPRIVPSALQIFPNLCSTWTSGYNTKIQYLILKNCALVSQQNIKENAL